MSFSSILKTHLKEDILPKKLEELKKFKSEYGNHKLGDVTLGQAIGGMRGINGLLYLTSKLDAQEGIRLRGYDINSLREKLPKAVEGGEPLPEALLWLLIASDIPTEDQCKHLQEELQDRYNFPEHVEKLINGFSKDLHPMTQFSMGVLALQEQSNFAKAYARGVHKSEYWEYIFEDALDLIANIPRVAALIYRNLYKDGKTPDFNKNLDWAANYSHMLGHDEPQFYELMRLYQVIHSDHEGGNVSAHAVHLVGSALSDPYLSFSAGLNGLAGPLHGLANQEVLKFFIDLREKLGDNINEENLEEALWDILKSGRVIPGYGHAVLRKTDPRYTAQAQFAEKWCKDDPNVQLVKLAYKVVPKVLNATGKVANPWPNVDAHSGVLLTHYGMTEYEYYTVLFGVSRSLGTLANMVYSRALGLPIERPGSIDFDWIRKNVVKQ
eukprot:CAMPEP_0115034366 /NCGR_PEP_ID=MMETSP0216-20121206/40601_1 /TAXON_ID=223996 /ORGANISM="Protocruzia adherens, Strain Boccale" /LENGTH=438 /DNA_ID=CAMNT_0002413223 /DNA_START=12 /DNA_END=1328 /DNA_ORIENTATION=+